MNRFYVTTPIYYVNDDPHIGHAYTTVIADILARYHRSAGDETFFLTGVDEHGQKVEKAARERGIAPQAHCDEMAPRFSGLWPRLGIAPSAFLRTTDAAHKDYVRSALARLRDKGLIEARDFEGWYCTPCERFWTEKDLVESSCPDCRRGVALLREKNYFFLMSRFAEPLKAAIEKETMRILPAGRKNEVLGFLDKGLGDLCISRPKQRLSWGIPLPFDEDYVTYVWFDALLNYASGPSYLVPGGPAWWPATVHLIGKDILTTHAVYWPAMLMALELPLPRILAAHGWWTVEGQKMSKSLGNVIAPLELVASYASRGERPAVDAFRHFLASEMSFGADGDFSRAAFERRWTSDLSNDIGNLLSRVTALVDQILGGEVESIPDPADAGVVAEYRGHMEAVQPHRAVETAMAYVRARNQYLQQAAPWSRKEEAPAILGRAVASLRLVSALMAPVMPDSADEMARRLGLERAPALAEALSIFRARCRKGDPLFARPERQEDPKAAAVPAAPPSTGAAVAGPYATIDDLKKLGLCVGVVKSAERVEKTKKLLKLTVDIGRETRTLVAGIAEYHAPEELIGRRVVVVSNLQPAVIRGIESRGMILAASDGASFALLSPGPETVAGTEVR